ncbi:dipeptide ABC transporter ATP-binding protein [Porticoccus sp. W117]|uniref:ABC transporter ATP-binding protein n=1 Tax=Porticoccus sp. W117 TaxID=3054777 RepID=UPI0025931D57|nr:dipeptide ABC transporter ATP-binding protein [Porticoccus sp. W117]MDM3871147.1 dipeptide ABC transporter ATP-binding protein [Porticoccus sp. W117]
MSLLDVKNLRTYFHTRNGVVKSVDDVSFSIDRGETLAIVGESGSGKSVSCYSLLNLIPQPPGKIESGSALFDGRDLLQMTAKELRQVRGNEIAIIFQDPMTSLTPHLTVGEQLIEPLLEHRDITRSEARQRAIAMLDEVGITNPEQRYHDYPHQFSGGMRQRVMIAMALITEPKLLICDEPTTALDVTVQAQVLQLIHQLQQRHNIAVLFISHDLAVVSDIADNVAVMQKGKVVEQGSKQDIFEQPQHPYTKQLLAAIPHGGKQNAPSIDNVPLVSGRNLQVAFAGAKQQWTTAVNGVSLDIHRGEILGLVGESGSGKSTTGRALLKLISASNTKIGGQISYQGEEIQGHDNRQMLPLRRRMQMIFQDPYASLNPRMTVFDTLAEPLLYHSLATRKNVTEKVLALMDDVGLARAFVRKYPHEFSGGQRQRIAIGRAIATDPEFIVADEPVSALDVTIQAQILELILQLSRDRQLTMLFISHDLSVVRVLCDRVAVMYQGEIIESGKTEQLFNQPKTDYCRRLLAAVPSALVTNE